MGQRVKQIIVMRKDLNMRKGKQIAQGAHASVGALLSMGKFINREDGLLSYNIPMDNLAVKMWLEGSFTKICVYVNSEKELIELESKAKEAGILHCLITDNGLTEFKGVKTKTCLAIGPAFEDVINKITGHLPLL